ncbi:uncharacterized protein N7459_007257 [Penicillium hispanicum]|uniref:uncharacterized protein n=1 Tax=Penicillium hispanicum TaxID=1080232 RepID=UPI00254013E5|nr:uncharacterized protein N7459_007257 [Penicillium hispanicum]KAJ5578293.1 hypothetical protein N7459_007257 [Penicillium hispanicum]
MAVSALPSAGDAPDLTLLNASRLFTRLEHNLLSPGSELRTLRQSEFQRMRVTKNVEYARSLLSQLQRSVQQVKQADRRHEMKDEITREHQLLARIQRVLDEANARADDLDAGLDAGAEDGEADEWEELFAKPIAKEQALPTAEVKSTAITTTASTPTATTASIPAPAAAPSSTLRNRHVSEEKTSIDALAPTTGKATGRSISPQNGSKLEGAEQELGAQRLEQEDLTTSLLSLASQLKASSQTFQATLENEHSVLDRAVQGIDKTSTTMEAAGQRMGMLRRMTEGKGWWGRMILYAWIFGLWIVAVLIVFVGPKLRF